MRIKRVLVLVFLLVLYVVPTNVSAAEWGTSDQSITSFSEETGWLHDCSNTTGIANTTAGDTVTSDGDIITLTSDVDGGSFEITVSSITTADYPFLVLNCTSISSGDGWKLEQLNTPGGTWYTLQSDYATTTGIYRYNMKALSAAVETFRINVTQTATIKFDFFYAYTIAEFSAGSISLAGIEANDYLYVDDSGVLQAVAVGETDGSHYFTCWTGYVLSVDTSIYTNWTVTTDSDRVNFNAYVSGFTEYGYGVTEGELVEGTLTGIKIFIADGDGFAGISAITYSGFGPNWEEVGDAIVYFEVPFDYWALNMSLVFGGLIIMLFSVCLMAVKVRDRTITRDAGLLLFFLFCVGWGLFIGGTIIG